MGGFDDRHPYFEALKRVLARLGELRTGGRKPATDDELARVTAEVCNEVARFGYVATSAIVPYVVDLLTDEQPAIRCGAASMIASALHRAPPVDLIALDKALRESTFVTYTWSGLAPEEVDAGAWPLEVWGLFSMHVQGRIRERATRVLAAHEIRRRSV